MNYQKAKNFPYKIPLMLVLTLFLVFSVSIGNVGECIAANDIPITSVGYDQQNPHTIFVTDPDNPSQGLWFVTWEDSRNSSTTGADIYGKFINANGSTCGSEFIISNGTTTQQMGTGNGSTTAFSGTLLYKPVIKSSVTITGGSQTCRDNGPLQGLLYTAGNNLCGTVNYSTGVISVTFPSAPASNAPVNVQYTSRTNQTAPRAAYRTEDGTIAIVWQDTRPNYVYYNTISNIDFTPQCNNTQASLDIGTETTIGYNRLSQYSYATLFAEPENTNWAIVPRAPAIQSQNIGVPTDCVTRTFFGPLSHLPIPGSVSITDGIHTITDDGHGNIVATNIVSGTINYTTGQISVTFATPPGPCTGTNHITASYMYYASSSNGPTTQIGDIPDCVSTAFSGVLDHLPVIPGSIRVKSGSNTFADDGHGNIVATNTVGGTIDYNAGAISVNFVKPPGTLNPPGCTLGGATPCICSPPVNNITADYNYYPSFPPSVLTQGDSLLSRQAPRIAYDPTGDQFWIVWKETRTGVNVTHQVSELCFADTVGAIAASHFDDSDFVGYVRLDGYTFNENDSLIGVPGADIIRNEDTSTVRLISTDIAPLLETRIYESFKLATNPDVSCDDTSTQCLMVFEGVREKETLTCTCTDKNNNGSCDLADIVTATWTEAAFDDGVIHIYGISDNYIPLAPVESMKLDSSTKESHYPALGFDPISKRFLTAWEDSRDSSNQKIYGRLIQSGGGLYNSDFIISFQDLDGNGQQDLNVANSKQTKPFISYDSVNQRFFVVWQDGRNSTLSLENLDIYGQRVDGEGSLRGNNYAITVQPSSQLIPTVAYNEVTNQFLAVWKDARNSVYNTCSATGGVGSQGGTLPCGSDVYGNIFTLGQPSLTLLNPDNTALAPPLLQSFENPVGSGGVAVGLAATQSFKVRNTGDTTLHIDCIDEDVSCNPGISPNRDITPFSFDGEPSQLTACNDQATIDLVPAAELTLTVRFTPTVGGSFNRCFIIRSDGGSPQVNLSALSKEADISVTYPDNTVITTPSTQPSPQTGSLYNFGTVNIGGFKDGTFVVKNTGIANLMISSVDSPSAPFSLQSDGCSGQSIVPGATCNIVIRFKPTAATTYNSNYQFSIHSNDPDAQILTIPIGGAGQGAPHINVSPLTVAFGNVQLNQSSQQIVTIKNDGTQDLQLNSISSLTPPFSSSSTCGALPATLAVNTSCQVTVTFSPQATGGSSAAITITSSDTGTGPVTVNLSGTGVATPQISVSDNNSWNFPSTSVGLTTTHVFTVTNVGTAPLTISSLTNPAVTDFSITGSTCIGTFAQNAQCTITIAFAPQSAGFKQSSFQINSNDPLTPVATVFLSGTGSVLPSISISPSPLNFGNVLAGLNSSQAITVSNTGSANLNISSVSAPAAPFSITSNTCTSASLVKGASCQITVKFAPTAAGTFNSNISITSNDANSPSAVSLSGTGTASAQIQVSLSAPSPITVSQSPASFNFGSVKSGTISPAATITVSNTGGANLVIGTVTYPKLPYRVTSDTCKGQTITPGSQCQISVVFNPLSPGIYYSYTMTIPSNDTSNSSVKVAFSGVSSR